jgi:hypothetical protein
MDQLGAVLGHITGKEARITGNVGLPVYNGKLAAARKDEKPKGEITEKQKQLNDYLKKYTQVCM